MTKEPNLKEIERRAYMSYHQDGLLDIFAGIYILGFALGILMDVLWDFSFGAIMPGIIIATVMPLWIAAKRKITIPRIGFVNFGHRGANKIVALLIGLIVVGLAAFFAFIITVLQSGSRLWLDLIIQNGLLIIGVGSLAVCALFGYSMGLKRLYAYGVIAVASLAIGHFMDIFFVYILLALGITVMVTGIAVLMDFVRRYPLKGGNAIAE